jgi:hypothetical protein
MNSTKTWEGMTWQEKREERFKRWISPPQAKFDSLKSAQTWREKTTRLARALNLQEPDRVPCMLPTGNFAAAYAGTNLQTVMYDYNELRRAWLKFL